MGSRTPFKDFLIRMGTEEERKMMEKTPQGLTKKDQKELEGKVTEALTKEMQEEQKRLSEEMSLKSEQRRAVSDVRGYFREVKESLKRSLLEVERNEKKWEEVLADKPYPDGKPQPKSHLVAIIDWTVSYMQQTDFRSPRAVRAGAKIARAFDIEV